MVDEVSGDMRGAATPGGRRPDISASRSATPWRAMIDVGGVFEHHGDHRQAGNATPS